MDTFFEQIISIKKSSKQILLLIGLWLLALILCAFLMLTAILKSLTLFACFGILFGAFKLSGKFNIEYEYIITNGIMDVDKIINKSARKRILSFDLAKVTRLEKYNPFQVTNINNKDLVIACNKTDSNAYLLVAEKENGSATYLVFSPNDKISSALVKFVPKFIANSAFK